MLAKASLRQEEDVDDDDDDENCRHGNIVTIDV
jgi:hypothetical protein